jgi:hypothetical protein
MMSDLFQKMRTIGAEVARERGGILFFGLLKAADLPDEWDLVIVATWVQEETLPDLRYVAEKLQAQLAPAEILSLARIVLLGPDDARLLAEAGAFHLRPGRVEAVSLSINELLITQAYIITADPEGLRRSVSPTVASTIWGPATTPQP